MSLNSYFQIHWLNWLSGGLAAALVWIAAHWVAGPLLEFLSDRRHAIEAIQEHGSVGVLASEETVNAAHAAVATAAKKMLFYAQAGPGIVMLYCGLRRYDLRLAGLTLNGLFNLIGSGIAQQGNQCDAARLCLGATRLMPIHRQKAIRTMMRTSLEDSAAVSPSKTP